MQYQAPANDLRFLLFDVLGADRLHELEKYADATPDLISAVIDEAGKLAAEVIQPTNQAGDREGCTYDPETHSVKTPECFKDAYKKFVEGGWTALDAPLEYGGQGFGQFKPALAELLVSVLEPIRDRFVALKDDRESLDAILARGASQARELAGPTLDQAYTALGLVR